jgi:ABC-2 type transport system permease protein
MARPSAGRLLLGQLGYSLRDLWRTRIVFVFTFLFPLTWLVVLGFIAGNATVDDGSGVRVMQYVTPTAAVMGVLYGAFPTVASSFAEARERGVLKRVRGTPLPPWAHLAGRIGAAVVFSLASVTAMLVVGVLAYDVQVVWRTAPATAATVLVAIACFAACGLAVATLTRSANVAQSASIAVAVVLAFLSGVLFFGDMPDWADRIASIFPLKSFTEAVQDQFDPFGSGSGWDLGALAMLAAWGAAGTVVAASRFRWDPATSRGTKPTTAPGHPVNDGGAVTAPSPGALTATVARPTPARMLLAEVRWATRAALRDPGWVFFAIAMPVGLYAFIASSFIQDGTGAGVTGAPIGLEVAAGMTAWGAAVTAFINMPEAVAAARDRGALKRLRGTPLPSSLYLAGRTVSALWIALVTGALVLVLGMPAFGLEISWTGLPLAVLVLLLGTTTLAACGLALVSVLPSSKAVTAVGLAVLLPLGFFSDVFAIGGAPGWMRDVGDWLPLKPLANSLTAALDPAGPSLSWGAVAVMVVWLVGASALAVRTFRWSARS